MSADHVVLVIAGAMVLVSVVLARLHSQYWLLLAAYSGVNLMQSPLTGICPLAWVLRSMGFAPGPLDR